MIRQISKRDKHSVASYLASKLNVSISDALIKTNKIMKNGFVNFIKEEKDLTGVCYIESKLVDNKKLRFIEIHVNNWRLAENFIQCLRWNLNGEFWFSLPKHDFLNRTFNKNGIRFMKVDGNRNLYCYRFEKRNFYNFKNEDEE